MRSGLVLVGLVFGFGCGKGGLDGKLDELAKIRDAMCACKDKACADTQHEAYTAWKKSNKSDETKPDGEQMKRYDDIRKDMRECRHKAAGDSTGSAAGESTP